MFPMTATLHNQAQLNAFLAAMGTGNTDKPNIPAALDVPTGPAKAPEKEAVAKETTAKKPTPATKTQAESAPTQPIAEAAEVVVSKSKQEATSAPEAAAASPVSYPDVVTAINTLAKAKGRDAAVDLLAQFGAAKGPDLKPEQFAEFIQKATAATGA